MSEGTTIGPEGLPVKKTRGHHFQSDIGSDSLIGGPNELAEKPRGLGIGKRKETRGLRDWQTTGITARNVQPVAAIEDMAMRQMAVWEARIEDKRYDELANGVRDLEDGLVEAQTNFNEIPNRPAETRVDELRAHIKARLKLHRAYGIWKDHAHDSMEDIREGLDKAEVKLDGEWFDTLLNSDAFRAELGILMVTGPRPDFTDDEMTETLQQRIATAPNGTADQTIAFTRLAWEMFTTTAAAAELGDPDIENPDEFRGVKKAMNPRVGVWQDVGLSGTVDPVEFALLDQTVDVIPLHNQSGGVIGYEGRRLDGTPKQFSDYLGMHNFWLYLSEYQNGRFWTEQNPVSMQQVIDRHRNFRDANHPNGIILLNPDGTPQRDAGGNFIPVPVPVDAEDLTLVDWTAVRGHNHNGEILMGEAHAKWLDLCRKSEWSRKYVGQDILPNLGAPETMEVIAEVAGEVGKVKKDKPIFQRHVPFDRKIQLVDALKGWVAERFIRVIEQGLPRDANLQKTLNQAIYYFGGDAGRLRSLYERSFSYQSLNKEPISIAQAATYLRNIYADQNPIDFDGYQGFTDPDFPDPISLWQVLERAAETYGWEAERPGQNFHLWLDETRNDPRFSDRWTWRVDQKNEQYEQLQTNLTAAITAGNQDEARRNRNLLILMGRFIEPIYQFSTFQRDYFEFLIRDAIGYFKTDETHLYDRFVQHELIYRAALRSLRRFTPNEPLPGDRLLETVAGAIMRASPWEQTEQYGAPADRDATNHPVWLEGDDRRRALELIMMGTDSYINHRYVEKDFNLPRHPKTKALLQGWQLSDNCEDRAAVLEVFERKGRVGTGFVKPEWLKDIRKILHCTATEVELHRIWRWVFGVKDETIETIINPLSQTAKGVFSGIPIIGPLIGKAQELNIAPIVENVGEALTYGTLAIPLAGLVFQALNIPELTLPGNFLASWGIPTPVGELTIIALSAKGILGAIINRKIIQEQVLHRILRAEWFRRIPILGKMSVKESLNVNRNDDVKSILETRGL